MFFCTDDKICPQIFTIFGGIIIQLGAKGMSELPMNGAAPAIANAIYNEVGIRLTELPMTPERISRTLKGK